MTEKPHDLLPSASACRMEMAQIEPEKASEYASMQATAEAEKNALLDWLSQPSGVTDDERLKRAATIREMWA